MIDFVSTRPGVDPETRRAAQILAAIVVQFVRDASIKPSQDERAIHRNMNSDARRAIWYFFSSESDFERHIEMLGGSAASFREALLSQRPLSEQGGFTSIQRRIIQARYRWWNHDHNHAPPPPPSED